MRRWQCALVCLAIAPAATVVAAWLLSAPILDLYEVGRLGENPTWPLIHISCGGLSLGILASAGLWFLLQIALPRSEKTHLKIWTRGPSAK